MLICAGVHNEFTQRLGVAPALEVRALAIRDAALVRVADADATI